MKIILNLLVVLILSTTTTLAENAPMKFGKVSMEELLMTKYDKDTSASAVILCDYGYFNADEFTFTRTIRVKILKKEGLQWANHTYRSNEKTSVRGRTFNIENGEKKVEKLKFESIFKEKITKYISLIRVAMPNVKVGSVIDIEYKFDGMPKEWKFQNLIPIVWSELRLDKNEYIKFNRNFFGYEPLYISNSGRWVAKEVPAFKMEPNINSYENYITKFEFDILKIDLPMRFTRRYYILPPVFRTFSKLKTYSVNN